MKYISLFSGIGGFEHGIEKVFPDATCIGHSEIDESAISVYKKHFKNHKNLGDITKIGESQIEKCDLIVGGFPCTNLSSLANFKGNNDGIEGPKSSLFYDFVKIIKYAMKKNKNVKFIIENNNSMRKTEKEKITSILKENFNNIFTTLVDNSFFGVQKRERLIWTNFPISIKEEKEQTWTDVLEPVEKIKSLSEKRISCLNTLVECKRNNYPYIVSKNENDDYIFTTVEEKNKKSRWEIQKKSDTRDDFSRPITGPGGSNNILIDRRISNNGEEFIPRKFTLLEMERLFGLPDNYTQDLGIVQRERLLGNSIPVFIVKNVLKNLIKTKIP